MCLARSGRSTHFSIPSGGSLAPDSWAYAQTSHELFFISSSCLFFNAYLAQQCGICQRRKWDWIWGLPTLTCQPLGGPLWATAIPEEPPGNSGAAKSWSDITDVDRSRIVWFQSWAAPPRSSRPGTSKFLPDPHWEIEWPSVTNLAAQGIWVHHWSGTCPQQYFLYYGRYSPRFSILFNHFKIMFVSATKLTTWWRVGKQWSALMEPDWRQRNWNLELFLYSLVSGHLSMGSS